MELLRYTSIKQIVEETYRDTGFQKELPWEDLISWTFDALQLIGHPVQYIRKVTGVEHNPNLNIEDFRAEIPCDVFKIEQVAINGFPAKYSSDTFHHLLSGSCCGLDTASAPSEIFTDNFGNQFSPQLGYSTSGAGITDYTFDVNDNYFTTNVRTGEICLAYWAHPIDHEGFPQVPDHISFKEAVKKYLTMKLDYISWRRGDLPGDVFSHSEREWTWYCGQAKNKANMPSVAQMENIKNDILRLKPEINQYNNFFKDLGSPERRKIH